MPWVYVTSHSPSWPILSLPTCMHAHAGARAHALCSSTLAQNWAAFTPIQTYANTHILTRRRQPALLGTAPRKLSSTPRRRQSARCASPRSMALRCQLQPLNACAALTASRRRSLGRPSTRARVSLAELGRMLHVRSTVNVVSYGPPCMLHVCESRVHRSMMEPG